MINYSYSLSYLVFLVYLLGSCKHIPSKTGFEVVEKSHLSKPLWLRYGGGELIESDQFMRFTYKKDLVLELPLGIQQAQEAALAEFRQKITQDHLKSVFNSSLCQRTQVHGSRMEQRASVFTQNEIRENAVRDLYFEGGWRELKNGSPQKVFEISVLLEMPIATYVSIKDRLSSIVQEEPNNLSCFN